VDSDTKEGLAAKKEFMVIGTTIRSAGDAVETVQVQLPLKGGILLLLEEPGKDESRKVFRFQNEEASAVWLPTNDVGEMWLVVFNGIQHLVEFLREGHGNSALGVKLFYIGRGLIVGVLVIIMMDAVLGLDEFEWSGRHERRFTFDYLLLFFDYLGLLFHQ
jgi:hypothetical protein